MRKRPLHSTSESMAKPYLIKGLSAWEGKRLQPRKAQKAQKKNFSYVTFVPFCG